MSIELEYKFLVRKDEFDHIEAYLLSILPSYKTVKQTNFYYDTTDYLLFRSGVTCRIRCSDNKLNGALKIHRTLDSNENIELAFKK